MSAIAKLFFDQAVGKHEGHMSMVPNNPLFLSIFNSAGYRDGHKDFVKVLRRFADDLEKTDEEIPF